MTKTSARIAPKLAAASMPSRRLPEGRAAPRSAQPDRRLNILVAAERLFALHGYHAVSIRDIAAEAEVPLALVGYYYGAKHELYRAIFASWQGVIDQRLAALRAVLDDVTADDALERIVDAFVSPVIAMHRREETRYFALMAARELTLPTPEGEGFEKQFFDPMAHAFVDALMTVFPRATRGQVAWCYQFSLGAMYHFLLTAPRVERLSKGDKRGGDVDAGKALLLSYIAAGFRGALSAALLAVKANKTSIRRQA